VEDTAAVLLRFAGGALGTVLLSDTAASPFAWDQTAGENPAFQQHAADAYRISGTEGTLELPSLRVWRYAGARGWLERLHPETLPSGHGDPLALQTRHFLRVARREEAPLVPGEDGARTVAATLAVSRSAREGREVRVADMLSARGG
jgi:predicted dehydrogenase